MLITRNVSSWIWNWFKVWVFELRLTCIKYVDISGFLTKIDQRAENWGFRILKLFLLVNSKVWNCKWRPRCQRWELSHGLHETIANWGLPACAYNFHFFFFIWYKLEKSKIFILIISKNYYIKRVTLEYKVMLCIIASLAYNIIQSITKNVTRSRKEQFVTYKKDQLFRV